MGSCGSKKKKAIDGENASDQHVSQPGLHPPATIPSSSTPRGLSIDLTKEASKNEKPRVPRLQKKTTEHLLDSKVEDSEHKEIKGLDTACVTVPVPNDAGFERKANVVSSELNSATDLNDSGEESKQSSTLLMPHFRRSGGMEDQHSVSDSQRSVSSSGSRAYDKSPRDGGWIKAQETDRHTGGDKKTEGLGKHASGTSKGSTPRENPKDRQAALGDSQTPTVSSQPSRLEDSQRRRLSVSTVSHPSDTPGDRGRLPVLPILSGQKKTSHESSTRGTAPTETAVQRRSLKKYPDPALELLNNASGAIREVTLSMLLDLLDKSSSSLLIFGAPCNDLQRGFDNKRIDVAGTLARSSFSLAEHGVGYACKKGLKPESPNQDDFFIVRVDDWALYGVFDGHGPYGHDVSSFIHKVIPFLLLSDAQFDADPLGVMRRCFRKAHHLLQAMCQGSDKMMDCTLSGTTGTVILHRDNKFFVAHVGDSRSVLSTRSNGRLKAVNLTNDHKPTCDEERRRIEACGGEVRRLEGDIPYRVFVRDRMYPGLAMSRAIGDTVGAAVGVVPDPDVKMVELKDEDQFLIISTDGVWEFISSQEAVDFVCQKTRCDVQKAAEFLAYESWRRWVEEEENVVDDVTCLIVWVAKTSESTATDEQLSSQPETESGGKASRNSGQTKQAVRKGGVMQ